MKTKRKSPRRKRNPSISLDRILEIAEKVVRDNKIHGLILRGPKVNQFTLHKFIGRKTVKINIIVNEDEDGFLIFGVGKRKWLLVPNGDEIYWFLQNLFNEEL